MYLGIDFWKKFGLLSKITDSVGSVSELDVGREESNITAKNHELSTDQQDRLSQVISKLPSYEKEGLGRTHIMEHIIDIGSHRPVKQRHCPVSPAKEKAMFSEIENMLAMDVFEESKSPWSSNCVLVQKGEKTRLCLHCLTWMSFLADCPLRDSLPAYT